MTSKDFVNAFNEQYADNFHAVADNQGNIKVMNIMNSMNTLLFDYNGNTWEFRGDGYAPWDYQVYGAFSNFDSAMIRIAEMVKKLKNGGETSESFVANFGGPL